MTWTAIDPTPNPTREAPPRIVVYGGKSTNIRLNATAHALLGSPSRVVALRDDKTGRLAFRPAREGEDKSLAVAGQGSRCFVSAVSIKRAMGWDGDDFPTTTYQVTLDGDLLVVGDPVEDQGGDDD